MYKVKRRCKRKAHSRIKRKRRGTHPRIKRKRGHKKVKKNVRQRGGFLVRALLPKLLPLVLGASLAIGRKSLRK